MQKLFLSVATGGFLLGASGAAMAVGCPDGTIIGQTVDEIVINGEICVIFQTRVTGKVEITNSPILEMTFTDVGGPVTITGDPLISRVTVARVDVLQGNLTIAGSLLAVIAGNDLGNGNLVVNNNAAATIYRNDVRGTPLTTVTLRAPVMQSWT